MNNTLCYYVNFTQKIQIARVSYAAKIYLERVVFPLQQVLFEAPLEAQLEISMSAVGHLEIGDPVLVELISCRRLEVSQISEVSEIGDAILAA